MKSIISTAVSLAIVVAIVCPMVGVAYYMANLETIELNRADAIHEIQFVVPIDPRFLRDPSVQ